MKRYGLFVVAAVVLILAAGAALETWRDRKETQAAARNFSKVLYQIKQTRLQPVAVQGSRPLASTGFAALLNSIASEARNFGAESQALEEKFRAVDLSDVLAPASLTSAEGIAASRLKVKAMRALILERKRMLQSYTSRMEGMLLDAPVADDEKRYALVSFEEKKPRTMGAYRGLENAQKTVIARTSAILDFAKQNLGSAAVRNGQLQFKSKPKADQYNLLLEQLRHAAAAEEIAIANMAAMQEQAKREAEQALAKLAD